MSNDKDKLLQIMASLESDYAHGKISREKYLYFRSKYEDKINSIDAKEATNRIRSMQGKPQAQEPEPEDEFDDIAEEKEKEDLVQKYIINPKKGDEKQKEKVPMSSGTFMLVAMLVLVIGFTMGVGFGVFSLDTDSLSNTEVAATVTDTAFPDVADVSKMINNTANTTNKSTNATDNYNASYSGDVAVSQDGSYNRYSYNSYQSQDTGGGVSPQQQEAAPAAEVTPVQQDT